MNMRIGGRSKSASVAALVPASEASLLPLPLPFAFVFLFFLPPPSASERNPQVFGKNSVAFALPQALASCRQSFIPGIDAHSALSDASGSLQFSLPAAAPCLHDSHPGIECEEHIAWTDFAASAVEGALGSGPGFEHCGTSDPFFEHKAFQGSQPFILGISVQIVPTSAGWPQKPSTRLAACFWGFFGGKKGGMKEKEEVGVE